MRHEEIVGNIRTALGRIMEDRGEFLAREIVRRELHAQVSDASLQARIDRLILGGWTNEKRRLFMAGAEWARNFGDADGFYTAAEEAANLAADGRRRTELRSEATPEANSNNPKTL